MGTRFCKCLYDMDINDSNRFCFNENWPFSNKKELPKRNKQLKQRVEQGKVDMLQRALEILFSIFEKTGF